MGPVAACVKWVDLHPETDVANGVPRPSEHSWGFSEADRAAFEVAMRLAGAAGTDAVLVCAGPVDAAAALRELAASGAARAVLIEHPLHAGPGTSGAVLAGLLGAGGLGIHSVVCGDLSNGRGSGSVPAILAHHLGAAQALGLLETGCGP
jgi:electron transfer flavoprotein beta subunit